MQEIKPQEVYKYVGENIFVRSLGSRLARTVLIGVVFAKVYTPVSTGTDESLMKHR
jgi:hypothetical protein